ncbi:MAG: transposase [Dehalococcoidales bacterium]
MASIIHKQSVNCKYCSSANIVKYGTFQGMQRYFCKDCCRKFADNDALPKMKTPVWIISLTLNCYYNGMSLAAIQNEINQRHGAYYAQSSIYNWIMRFSKQAALQTQTLKPVSGDTWFLSITPVISDQRRLYFLDIFDMNSKFLLVSKLIETVTAAEVTNLIKSTYFKTQINSHHPVTIMLSTALSNTKLELKALESENANNFIIKIADFTSIKGFNALLKKRNRVVHNFRSINKAQILAAAWQLYYNFIMDNDKPKYVVPAYKIGNPLFKNWEDIISQP